MSEANMLHDTHESAIIAAEQDDELKEEDLDGVPVTVHQESTINDTQSTTELNSGAVDHQEPLSQTDTENDQNTESSGTNAAETEKKMTGFGLALLKAKEFATKLSQEKSSQSESVLSNNKRYHSEDEEDDYGYEQEPETENESSTEPVSPVIKYSQGRHLYSSKDAHRSKRLAYENTTVICNLMPVPLIPVSDSGKGVKYSTESQESSDFLNLNSLGGSQEFTVPQSTVGLIIGRSGETLKRIESQTGSRVQFAPVDVNSNEALRRCTVYGQPQQIEDTKSLIQSIVDEAVTGRIPPPASTRNESVAVGQRQFIIRIPNSKVGLVIGRSGETVKTLQDRSGARINVAPDKSMKSGETERVITVIGDDTCIVRARVLIDELINNSALGPPPVKQPTLDNKQNINSTYYIAAPTRNVGVGGFAEIVEIPNDAAGTIIGRGGETIKWLQQTTGAKIQVEPSGSVPTATRKVHVTGVPHVVEYAKTLIKEQLAAKARGEHVGPGTVTTSTASYPAVNPNYGYGQQPVMSSMTIAAAKPTGYTQASGTQVMSAPVYDYSAYYAQYGQQAPQQNVYDYSAYYAYYQQQQQNR